MAAAIAPAPLTAADRCDRCGARAYVRALLVSGGELLFCAHHARQHEEALRSYDAEIHDQRTSLQNTPCIAPDGER